MSNELKATPEQLAEVATLMPRIATRIDPEHLDVIACYLT
jgi:hypothetical protein